MIVAHVGPPLGRTGGPSGYLLQLQSAAAADRAPRHDVRFPPAKPPAHRSRPAGLRTALGRVKRAIFGPPNFYRPRAEDLTRAGGTIDRMMRELAQQMRADIAISLDAAATADAIFTHDAFAAEAMLERRRDGQRVWMMCHGVMPVALYLAWSWAVPDADWRTLGELPDVRRWTDWELANWDRVDGLMIPCPEAIESFQIADTRFATALARARYVLSGASAPKSSGTHRHLFGRRSPQQRIGLYLGSPEPYRGFDALAAAVRLLPVDADVGIAVAGPDARTVPPHPLLRPLGRVEDVAALLASVDFLINVNRFSLFDLSTIEAAEAGKPLVLHALGGNRAFERIGAGCVMVADLLPRTIADCLLQIGSHDASTLDALGQQSRACWEAQLTPRHMWERHLSLYDEIG